MLNTKVLLAETPAAIIQAVRDMDPFNAYERITVAAQIRETAARPGEVIRGRVELVDRAYGEWLALDTGRWVRTVELSWLRVEKGRWGDADS